MKPRLSRFHGVIGMRIDNLECLDEIQLSAVKEISNIGLGHAAKALADMTGQVFHISVPSVDSMPVEKAVEILGDPESVALGVYMPFDGDLEGHLALLFPWSSARKLLDLLMGSSPESPADVSEIEASAMLEIGNILNGSFLNAISDMNNLRVLCTPPSVGVEMMISIVETIVLEAELADAIALSVETSLFNDSEEIKGFFLFIPTRESLGSLLTVMGVAEAA